MKVTIPASSMLMGGIQTVLNVVPPKTTLPILSNLLLETDGEMLRIGATDLDISIITKLPVQISEPGAITVPARKFAEIVRELPDTPVDLEVDGVKVILRCDRGVFRLVGVDKDEFPTLPDIHSEHHLSMSGTVLQRLIRKTLFAVSTDETRPALGGVFWRIQGGGVLMVATDGHRLAKASVTTDVTEAVTNGIIVPPKALNNLARLLGESEIPPQITISENHVVFDLDQTTLCSRLIEATFPDYERVIPSGNRKMVQVNRELLHSAIRRMAVLSNSTTREVRFAIRSGFMELSSSSHDIGGEAKEEVPVQYVGDDLNTAYDYRFLLEIIDRMESEEIILKLDTPVSAGLIVPAEHQEGEDYLCLLMPMRLTE